MSVAAGSFAGVTAVTATYPLDLVRAQLALQDHGKVRKYTGVIDALYKIPKQHGLSALYRGIGPTLVGVGKILIFHENPSSFLKTKNTQFSTICWHKVWCL